MLRCSVSGLIPLMASKKYKGRVDEILARHRGAFHDIMRHRSYYLLRELPKTLAAEILSPALPELMAKRHKDGLWYHSERFTYDILSAIKYTGLGISDGMTTSAFEGDENLYALLIKKNIICTLNDRDRMAISEMIAKAKEEQRENGSWEDTVVGTVVHMNTLLELGLDRSDPSILRGVQFLFANWNVDFAGMHTHDAYGLVGHCMFSTPDRGAEFESADRLKPEWVPRNACFRTLAIIPNSVCLSLLIRLGLEDDERVSRALDNVYGLFSTYGGLCASDIKKPFL